MLKGGTKRNENLLTLRVEKRGGGVLKKTEHELINYIDTKAKCRYLKKLTCKGILRQVIIRVFRLKVQSVMLVFSVSFVNCCSFLPSLWFSTLPPSPLSYVNKSVFTKTVCKSRGGYRVLDLRHINTCRMVPLQVNYFKWGHFALPSMSLVFLREGGKGTKRKKMFVGFLSGIFSPDRDDF